MGARKTFRRFQLKTMGFVAVFIGPLVLFTTTVTHRLEFPQSISETATTANEAGAIFPFCLGALALFAFTYAIVHAYDKMDKIFTAGMALGFTIIAMQMCVSTYVVEPRVGLLGVSPQVSDTLHNIGAIVVFGSMIFWIMLCFMKYMKKTAFITATMFFLFFTACGGGGGNNPSVTISISQPSTMRVGDTQQLTVTVRNTTNTNFTFSVSPATGLNCTASGNALNCAAAAVGSYEVTVTAAADTSKKTSARVTVDEAVAISISPPSPMRVGDTQQLTVTVQNTTNENFTFSVSPATGLDCAASGSTLTCEAAAADSYEVTVTASADTSKKASATVTVDEAVAISISQPSSMRVGDTQPLTVTVQNTTNENFTFSVSPATGLSCAVSGNVLDCEAAAADSYEITVTSSADTSKKASATVTVKRAIAVYITLLPGSVFAPGYDISYEISYPLGDVTGITKFEIVDTYPVGILSFKGFTLTVGGVNVSGSMIYVDDNGAGEVTFTLIDPDILECGEEIVLMATFTILVADGGISNAAELFIDDKSADTGVLDMYLVGYDANWPAAGGVDSVPGSYLYAEGDTVTVTDVIPEIDEWVFTGWNTADDGSGISYAAGDPLVVEDADVVLFAQWTGRVSKKVAPGFIFEYGRDISYEISYHLTNVTEITKFEIVDTYPVDSLSFKGFTLTVDGIDVSGSMTYDDYAGEVVFTLDNPGVLEDGKKIVLRTTFTIVAVDSDISNTAELFINDMSAGAGTDLLPVDRVKKIE